MEKISLKVNAVTVFVAGVLIGALAASTFFLATSNKVPVDYTANTGGTSTDNSSTSSTGDTSSTTDTANYETGIKEFNMDLEDGTSVTFHTPENFYSLSDQYLEAMRTYYGDLDAFNNMITVGDNAALAYTTFLISASPISSTREVLKSLYSTATDEELEDMLYSDAYILMKTGELPDHSEDETPSDLRVEEIKTETYQDIEWHFYKVAYTQEYYTDETQTETTEVPVEELVVYSNTEDSIEIVAYSNEEVLDFDTAIAYIEEFIR